MSEVENFFTDGEANERRMGRWSRIVGGAFLDWLAVPNGLRWIDVGCGNGAFTEVLIARCAPSAVSAVDPSEGQLSYARTRPGTKMAEFRIGDALALPYPDRSFDAAAMALAISYVPDPVKAATEMTRVAAGRLGCHLYVGSAWRRHSGRTDVSRAKVARYCRFSTGHRGVATGQYARGMGEGGPAVDRYACDPHPGRLHRLQRFLAVVQCTGGTKRHGDPQDVAVPDRTAQGGVARGAADRSRWTYCL